MPSGRGSLSDMQIARFVQLDVNIKHDVLHMSPVGPRAACFRKSSNLVKRLARSSQRRWRKFDRLQKPSLQCPLRPVPPAPCGRGAPLRLTREWRRWCGHRRRRKDRHAHRLVGFGIQRSGSTELAEVLAGSFTRILVASFASGRTP
jgi:hypothetical protein